MLYSLLFNLFVIFLTFLKLPRSTDAGLRIPSIKFLLPPIYWKKSNPIFRIDNTLNIIDVEIGDSIDIVCPQYPSDANPENIEYYAIYRVTREEYDTCHITFTNRTITKLILNCSRPMKTQMFTLSFRKFSPIPGGLEFRNGEDYYFTSTSTGKLEGINNLEGGHCRDHAMKVTFKVGSKYDGPSRLKQPVYKQRQQSQQHGNKKLRKDQRLAVVVKHKEELQFKNNEARVGGEGEITNNPTPLNFESEASPTRVDFKINRAYPFDPVKYFKSVTTPTTATARRLSEKANEMIEKKIPELASYPNKVHPPLFNFKNPNPLPLPVESVTSSESSLTPPPLIIRKGQFQFDFKNEHTRLEQTGERVDDSSPKIHPNNNYNNAMINFTKNNAETGGMRPVGDNQNINNNANQYYSYYYKQQQQKRQPMPMNNPPNQHYVFNRNQERGSKLPQSPPSDSSSVVQIQKESGGGDGGILLMPLPLPPPRPRQSLHDDKNIIRFGSNEFRVVDNLDNQNYYFVPEGNTNRAQNNNNNNNNNQNEQENNYPHPPKYEVSNNIDRRDSYLSGQTSLTLLGKQQQQQPYINNNNNYNHHQFQSASAGYDPYQRQNFPNDRSFQNDRQRHRYPHNDRRYSTGSRSSATSILQQLHSESSFSKTHRLILLLFIFGLLLPRILCFFS